MHAGENAEYGPDVPGLSMEESYQYMREAADRVEDKCRDMMVRHKVRDAEHAHLHNLQGAYTRGSVFQHQVVSSYNRATNVGARVDDC